MKDTSICFYCKFKVGNQVEYNADSTCWICPKCKKANAIIAEHKQIGMKYDKDKLDWSLLPLGPIKELIKVLAFGEKKYSRDNWQLVENPQQRYYSACMRHLIEWQEGRKKDKETKLPHLAHALCCIVFLLWFDMRGNK